MLRPQGSIRLTFADVFNHNCCAITYRLAEQHGSLDKTIAKEEVIIHQKEENLENILPTLEGIRKATLPLQESLGIPLDKKKEEHDFAMLLPP